MKKNLSRFEQSLQEKMAGYEMPYDPSSWVSLQRRMGISKTGGSVWIVSLVSTILALSGGALALYRSQHTPSFAQRASLESRFGISVENTTKGVSHRQKFSNQLNAGDGSILESSTTDIDNHSSNTPTNINAVNQGDILNISNTTSGSSISQLDKAAPVVHLPQSNNLIAFSCNVRKACQGEEVEFQTSNGPKSGSYLWNFGDGHFSDDVNPKHKFAKAGDYDVSLSITSDNGQINTKVINDMITIEAAPDANFSWEFVNSDPSQPEVKIVNLSEGGTSFEWSNGAESSLISDGAHFRLKGNGRQMIALNAKNAAGCTDGAVKYISVNSDFELGAPNQWHLKDGTFMPQGLKKSKVDFVLTIFDEQGNKVYTTNNRQKGWDGKLPSGLPSAEGSEFEYMVIITNDFTQEQQYFNGTFSVFP